jgi:hypothetical protein
VKAFMRSFTCGSTTQSRSARSSFQSASSSACAGFSGFFGSGGGMNTNSAASRVAGSSFDTVSILSCGLPWNAPTGPSIST